MIGSPPIMSMRHDSRKPGSRAIAAVAFDLDGTLIDSCDDIADAANHALARAGFPLRSREEVRGLIGDGAASLLARAADIPIDAPALAPLLEVFLDHYTRHPVIHTRLLPGVSELLRALQPLPLGLCTNKRRGAILAVLAELGIDSVFRAIVAGGDTQRYKPDAEPLLELARRLGVPARAIALIGDAPQDILCARAAGARTIGVAGPIASVDALVAARPDALVGISEVSAVLRSWGADLPAAR
jgi:2-phosphoglycolate phosphatase